MSKIKCTTLANASDSKSVPVDTVVQGSAKAWVNFNGTGTVAINAAFNVSSITDNGVGDYTLNFINALPSANYATVGMPRRKETDGDAIVAGHHSEAGTATTKRVLCSIASNYSVIDPEEVSLCIFI